MISNIVKYTQINSESNLLRLDSEFYSKELMDYDYNIKKMGFNKLDELLDVLTDYTANGSFASLAKNVTVKDEQDYAKWIRIQNLDNYNYDEDIRYVDNSSYDFLKKSTLYGNELLISKTGEYLGKCYIFNPDSKCKYTLADNIFLLKLKDKKYDNFIYSYINSEIGRKLLLRYSQGTGQPTIIKENLRELKIPKISEKYLNKISEIVNERFCLINESNKNYNLAKEMLNSEIIPKNFVFSNNKSVIKKFSETDSNTKRIDSEYYQEKYFQLDEIMSDKSKRLIEIVDIEKSVDPGSDCYVDSSNELAIPFIRISNLSIKGLSDDYIYVDNSRIKNIDKLFIKKDDILLSKDGSIGIAYNMPYDFNGILCGGILRLRIKDKSMINQEYLTLILNSMLVKMQAERDCGGSILEHWKKEQIENIKIPIISTSKQNEISEKIKLSFEQLSKSNVILERIKDAIKILIYEGENKSFEFLEKCLL